ncbi:MAG: PAS domain S-box protein [Deltaproteobacteria bacterium]|nr:PAS domain S-box protein [Deltaproteobacteria bacterium]
MRQSESQFEAVFNQTYQFTGILSPEGTIRNVNQSALDFAGVREVKLVGLKFWETPYWQHSEAIQAKVKHAVEQAALGKFERMEVDHIRFDGEIRCVDFSIKPVRDDAGQIFMLIAEGRDITDRKNAEEVLRLSEKNRILVENAHDAIFIIQDDVLQYANQSTETLLGYAAAELCNTLFTDYIHPDDREMVIRYHQEQFESRKAPGYQSFRILGRSMAILWVELNAIRIDWKGRPATMGFARDITSQKKMESQLLHSQKMEVIGTLAGGIAHDFSNTLQAISALRSPRR